MDGVLTTKAIIRHLYQRIEFYILALEQKTSERKQDGGLQFVYQLRLKIAEQIGPNSWTHQRFAPFLIDLGYDVGEELQRLDLEIG